MAKREKLDRSYSEHHFTRNAQRVHSKNMLSQIQAPGPMRGGIRL